MAKATKPTITLVLSHEDQDQILVALALRGKEIDATIARCLKTGIKPAAEEAQTVANVVLSLRERLQNGGDGK